MGFNCRICLKSCDLNFYKNIFESHISNNLIADVLAEFALIQVTVSDNLPKGICIECENQLKDSIIFQKKIQRTDMHLKQTLVGNPFEETIQTEYNYPTTSHQRNLTIKQENGNETVVCNQQSIIKTENVDIESETLYSSENINKIEEEEQSNNSDKQEEEEEPARNSINESDDFWRMIINDETLNKSYKCTICDEHFTNNKLYFVHCMVHDFQKLNTNNDKLKNKSFISYLEKRGGLDSKTKNGQYQCYICEKLLSQRSNLDRHYLIHLGIKYHSCQLCDKKFRFEFNLKYHMNSHTGERPFRCPICGKTYTNPGPLALHKRSHLKIKPFKCKTCDHSFAQKGQLMEHLPVHTNEKNFICEYCSKQFKSKSSLCKHLSIHKMAESCLTYECPTCGKSFGYKSLLTRHSKRHFAKKNYICNVCQKPFTEKGTLTIHMRIHENVKPYNCKICSKPFRQLPTLSKHMRVHTGETPFHCQYCPKKFGYKHHYQSHLKKCHQDDEKKDSSV